MVNRQQDLLWIKIGIVAGLAASVLYPTLILASLPVVLMATGAALLGPAIGIGSLGLHRLVRMRGNSVLSALGALHNVAAGCLFTAMALVQLAVRLPATGTGSPAPLVGVWLGLDVAWDVYIGLGTAFFACAMIRHPRFGWPFFASGVGIAAAMLGLNLGTFPTPPAEAGLVDLGPLVGLWYLVSTLRAWQSLGWVRGQLETAR